MKIARGNFPVLHLTETDVSDSYKVQLPYYSRVLEASLRLSSSPQGTVELWFNYVYPGEDTRYREFTFYVLDDMVEHDYPGIAKYLKTIEYVRNIGCPFYFNVLYSPTGV